MNRLMAAVSSVTESKLPRRMAWRVMMPNQTSSGSPGALLDRAP
jgi:hypothetical protein